MDLPYLMEHFPQVKPWNVGKFAPAELLVMLQRIGRR